MTEEEKNALIAAAVAQLKEQDDELEKKYLGWLQRGVDATMRWNEMDDA